MFYCKLTELDTVYDTYFAPLQSGGSQLLTQDDFLAYCVDSTHRYRKIADDEVGQYVLDGWRKVNADGTTSAVATILATLLRKTHACAPYGNEPAPTICNMISMTAAITWAETLW